ncbi:MAG TPA: acyl-CoA dehydrogenase [Dehalococcoidia bacterium]|nr:acyl-CoA dehydrogenase [Dehalococcoidia bacterium]
MDFRFSAQQEAFRGEVRDFLRKELTPDFLSQIKFRPPAYLAYSPEFTRKLVQQGWLGIGWPQEYGGQGRPYMEQLVYNEELAYHGAPIGCHFLAETMAGPTLMRVGTQEQKNEYLPRILAGEITFCLGYTEPGAGSDLASLQTRATANGTSYIINGQKTFITLAQHAHYCLLAARTDPDAPKHRGISLFIADMTSPGITVQPTSTIGDMVVNDIFFDDVHIPKTALVGEENKGWYHLGIALDYERAFSAAAAGYLQYTFEQILAYAREKRRYEQPPHGYYPLRYKLAQLAIDIEVGRMFGYRLAWLLEQGIVPFYEASIAKVFTSELERRLTNIGMEVTKLYGQLKEGSKWAPLQGTMERACQLAFMVTIGGGTSEIQRNIIAFMGLGLPR